MNLKAENLNKIDSIIDLIGNTPLIKLNQFSELSSDKKIYIKAEWFNPGGSIKDRAALSMIKEGIKKGSLTKEKNHYGFIIRQYCYRICNDRFGSWFQS